MTFDLDTIRARFPALSIIDGESPRIYFDNPGGTQVSQNVVDSISDCLVQLNANVHGYFHTSKKVDALIEQAHEAVADLLNAPSRDEIIFGQNMTTLTLHVSRSIGRCFKPGDEIILSRMDHDANVGPWLMLARDLDLQVRWMPFNTETFEFDLEKLDEVLTDRTKLVCVGGASNMTGTINDVKAISAKAHEVGAWTFIDAVQSVPHVSTDVQDLGCDFLACSAYKFFGPHQGMLWGRRELLEMLEPYKVRPASDKIPACFETGTQNHEGMAGRQWTILPGSVSRWAGSTTRTILPGSVSRWAGSTTSKTTISKAAANMCMRGWIACSPMSGILRSTLSMVCSIYPVFESRALQRRMRWTGEFQPSLLPSTALVLAPLQRHWRHETFLSGAATTTQ